MHEEDGRLIDAIANSEELELFAADIVTDFIDFKWDRFARAVHFGGFCFHVVYIIVLFGFVGAAFSGDDFFEAVPNAYYYVAIGVSLLYPLAYEGVQLYKLRLEYF